MNNMFQSVNYPAFKCLYNITLQDFVKQILDLL